VISVILAGGYARRLQPLAKDTPKPLLEVAGKPILSYLLDRLAELEGVQRTIISTNLRFEQQFRDWLNANSLRNIEVIADESLSEEEKPGAIRSLAETTAGISDDCLALAGDNLFTSSLKPMIHKFNHTSSPIVALYDIKDLESTKQYSSATLDRLGRIVYFVEKPVQPETTLIGTCIYIIPRKTLPRLKEYLSQTADADRPGSFIQWLHLREEIYGYVLDGHWFDIGTPEQYMRAEQTMRNLQINFRNQNP